MRQARLPLFDCLFGLILGLLTLSSTAQAAFFTAELPSPQANPNKGTHVLVVGKGLEVGDQWLRVAHTQALIFRDRPGLGSIKIISAIENKNYQNLLSGWGYKKVESFAKTMTGSDVLQQLAKIKKIESIDFIGHNGALYGFALEDYNHRFSLEHAKQLKSLRAKMGQNAVVRLWGCNTGWTLAPVVAEALQVPTAGSFTYADLQELHEKGEWFFHDAGRFPEGKWLKHNPLSFSQDLSCKAQGGCMRLKVVNSNYQGRHGSYAGTLPFLKYFCGLKDQNECFRRMAVSTSTLISIKPIHGKPSREDFAEVLADEFCPAWIDDLKRFNCKTSIREHILGTKALAPLFSTVNGTSVSCDFRSCQIQKDCSSGTCVLASSLPGASSTYVNEINAYLKGYELW